MAAISRIALAATLLVILAVVLIRAIVLAGSMETLFAKFGPDEILRLVIIRDWMDGQSWFDTTAYQMMPPDGVLIHWSRFIDAMIGGLIMFFSFFVSEPRAEMLAVSIWPTLLQICLIGVVGLGAKRLFGNVAACFAMLCAFTWPITSQLYFRPGHIDHHNVQILMIVGMTVAVVWPGRPIISGLIAGCAAGFALAVGLETLPYILLLGLLLFVRATWGFSAEANKLLGAFCAALLASAVVFWLGQTPASRYLVPVCDQLGLPVLSLIATATAASCLPMILGIKATYLRMLISVVIVGIGCLLTWPMLSGCIAGPYGALPVEVQEIIRLSIIEAMPGVRFASRNAGLYAEMMLPVAVTLVIAVGMWARLDKTEQAERAQRDVIGQLLILSAVGVLASFSQVRLALMAAGAVPLLAGFAMASLVSAYLASRASDVALKLLIAGLVIMSPSVLTSAAAQFLPKDVVSRGTLDRDCRDRVAMENLNALPPDVFLPPMNLSSLMLLSTHHSILAGPYHRSPEAFANGKIPFGLPDAEMKAYVDRIGAAYVMVCEGSNYGNGLATDLAKGGAATWLEPVALGSEPILVFKVLKDDGT